MVRSSMISIGAASEPAQQQGGVVGFDGAHATGDLHAAAADLAADHRRGHDLALALLEQQDGHALADVLARDVGRCGAGGIERGATAGSLVWPSKPGWASVRRSPVSTTCFLTSSGAAATLVESSVRRHGCRQAPARSRRGVVHHAHFQRGGAAEDVLGLGHVLHAGQLHDDALGALLLDHRLGDAELVDAVVQGGDVRLIAKSRMVCCACGVRQWRPVEVVGGIVALDELQVGGAVGIARRPASRWAASRKRITTVLPSRVMPAWRTLLSRIRVRRSPVVESRRLTSARHVHLEQEVHAAAQVEAEIHRRAWIEVSQLGGEADSRLSATT